MLTGLFRSGIYGLLSILDSVIGAGKIMPFLVCIMVALAALAYYFRVQLWKKLHKSGGRKFWILRRDHNNYFDQQTASVSGIDSETNSSICSEDEFINHQERYDMIF